MVRSSLILLALSLAAGPSLAQCPNGEPPPCRGAAAAPVRASSTAPDSTRIAILPFRITTADTLLGEGLAELLANEFTERPRAVHMGSVLRAWRRAGGGLREPLAQPDEIRLATGLGAGLLVDGSVVGLGSRLTLSASVISTDGVARRVTPVTGPADSIPQLVERMAAALLAAAGTRRAGPPQRLTESPAAMRAYLEGLTTFRRGEFGSAVRAFERAYAADSQFGRAAFMRWLAGGWHMDFGPTSQAPLWRERASSLKDRLSGADQLVIEASFGNLAVRERAVQALPESPELWYFVGDSKFHNARTRGWSRSLAEARMAFERSLALDSQITSLSHLLDIGIIARDTALVRAVWPVFDRQTGGVQLGTGLFVAWLLGDTRAVEGARRRIARSGVDTLLMFASVMRYVQFGFPAALGDEISSRVLAVLPPTRDTRSFLFSNHMLQGRPAAAERFLDAPVDVDTTDQVGFSSDMWLMMAAAFHDADRAVGEAARARLVAARPARDSASLRRRLCALRLWDALVLDSVVVDSDGSLVGRSCHIGLQMLRDARAGSVDSAAFARQDSVMGTATVLWAYSTIGPLIRARAWERAGYPRRALVSSRTGSLIFPEFFYALRRREEGRLAVMAGDTAGAIVAYRQYLDLRRDAEPWYRAQRDSVESELDRILPRGRAIP